MPPLPCSHFSVPIAPPFHGGEQTGFGGAVRSVGGQEVKVRGIGMGGMGEIWGCWGIEGIGGVGVSGGGVG